MSYLGLGVGGLFTYDLFLYSHGLLFRQISADLWEARGGINALLVPLIAVATRRNPQWSLDIFVSRQIVFYSASLVGAGFYLVAMSLVGYYIRLYGGTWGVPVQALFLFAAALVLLLVLFSGQVRNRLKVWLSKHFYRNKYDYRQEWLRLIQTLEFTQDGLPLKKRTIKALAQIIGSAGGTLWQGDESQASLAPKAAWNRPMPGSEALSTGDPLPVFLRRTRWIVDSDECHRRPERYAGLNLGESAYDSTERELLVPLFQDQNLLGFVALQYPRQYFKLNYEDYDLLKTVGQQMASYLAEEQAKELLAEGRQFEAYNRLTAFIMHDLNNLIAQQSLVVKNAAKFKNNPEFVEDTIATIDNSVQRMQRLLQQLKQGDSASTARVVRFEDVLREVVAKCNSVTPVPQLEVRAADIRVRSDGERLGMVLSHVVRNAQDATDSSGAVRLTLDRDDDRAVIEVSDTGSGMDPEFVESRLFRPFDSTKGSKGMGIGAYQAREFARRGGGELSVLSRPGEGTTVTIVLPLSDAAGGGQSLSAGTAGQSGS